MWYQQSQVSYWKQYEHGMVSREAVRKLIELVDQAADSPDMVIDPVDITKAWQIKEYLSKTVIKHNTFLVIFFILHKYVFGNISITKIL